VGRYKYDLLVDNCYAYIRVWYIDIVMASATETVILYTSGKIEFIYHIRMCFYCAILYYVYISQEEKPQNAQIQHRIVSI